MRKAVSSPYQELHDWYALNARELPWRRDLDPYKIWISETMLQQTTTTAVIPFFERFIAQFPTLKDLALSPIEQVISAWAGLGYYSRARNLHQAAKQLAELPEFPKSHRELLEYPGFGPYTARAVASIAFEEKVGVVDGNVIRVLSRFSARQWEWWKPSVRNEIQVEVDKWVTEHSSRNVNQALMELGRTICTPRSPSCPLCPLKSLCQGLKAGSPQKWPLKRESIKRQIWLWQPELLMERGRIGLIRNQSLPFLKGQWLLPGKGQKLKAAPKKFSYRHSITCYDIFVNVRRVKVKSKRSDIFWIPLEEMKQHVPTSLVQKAIEKAQKLDSDKSSLARARRVHKSRPRSLRTHAERALK